MQRIGRPQGGTGVEKSLAWLMASARPFRWWLCVSDGMATTLGNESSGAHARNGRDPAVDQEVCPDDVRRIVRREVNCQLRDFQRIGHPLAWIVGAEDV